MSKRRAKPFKYSTNVPVYVQLWRLHNHTCHGKGRCGGSSCSERENVFLVLIKHLQKSHTGLASGSGFQLLLIWHISTCCGFVALKNNMLPENFVLCNSLQLGVLCARIRVIETKRNHQTVTKKHLRTDTIPVVVVFKQTSSCVSLSD